MQATTLPPLVRTSSNYKFDAWDRWLMKRGQEMYAFYSTPLPKWPATKEVIRNRTISRIMREEKKRVDFYRSREGLNFVVEQPRVLPFRGAFIKKALANFKVWRQKRAQHNAENKSFKESKNEKSRHGLLQPAKMGR